MAKAVTQSQFYGWLGGLGLALALVLAVVAVGVRAGHDFASSQVHSQLTQERIYFPAKGSAALDPKEFPGLQQYAGQLVDSGDKAKAYADQFIWVHMMKASGGKTYAEVSSAAAANPTDQKLAALKTTLFQGDMLRSSLLTAYAFSVFGSIAGYAWPALAVAAVLVAVWSFGLLAKSRRAS